MKRSTAWLAGLLVFLFASAAQAERPLDAWILLADPDTARMSGSTRELAAARASGPAPRFWFRRGARTWVVTDPAVLARLQAALAPMDRLGADMEVLGNKLGKIGDKMGKLGKRMERLGTKLERRSRKLSELDHDDHRRSDLEREVERLTGEMTSVQKLMEVYQLDMQPHERSLEEMGRQMEQLSAAADLELGRLADEAVRSGKAVERK